MFKPTSPTSSPWKIQQRDPEEYEKDRAGKYADYFRSNEILPIPEILQKLEPRIVSLVVTDQKRGRVVGLKKEEFEHLLRKAGVPCQYFCRRSFATWDVLLPSREQAAKVASSHITTKFFRLQREYLGTCRIRVTACHVPAFITGEVLVAFLSAFGRVEEINLLRSADGLQGLCVPVMLDSGGLSGHSRNNRQQREADDGGRGGKTPAMLGL